VSIRWERRFLQRALAIFAVVSLAACSPDNILGTSGGWLPGTTTHFIAVGNTPRDYLLHVPQRLPALPGDTLPPYPLVLVLHGSSGSAEDIRETTRMDSLSDAYGFIVAYPQGTNGGGLFASDWNGGACCGSAARENVDDVGFFSALATEISRNVSVDQNRIYIAGFSSGAIMAYHAACKLAPMIAAIAVVSGSLKDDNCVPGNAVGLIAIHGTNDDQVPYNDIALTQSPVVETGIAAQLPPSVQFWAGTDGCDGATVSMQSPNVALTSFSSCTGAKVVLYTIEGGWHEWPSIYSDAPLSELSASKVIVQYFEGQSHL
jgi:polyhydroxybutyrate depolymerase